MPVEDPRHPNYHMRSMDDLSKIDINPGVIRPNSAENFFETETIQINQQEGNDSNIIAGSPNKSSKNSIMYRSLNEE
jgi:hypothetical protein